MVNLHSQYMLLKEEIDSAMAQVIASSDFINGEQVKLFERALADFLSVKELIPCGNGTDALQLALMALDLKPGDEVITTAFSFVASAEVIALMGLKPVFADIDPLTFNIDPLDIERRLTKRTRVILPVHLFGQAADMSAIMQLAHKYQLYVIEDVAQALGACYNYKGETKHLGTIGHIGCTSFFPTKNLACFGDGGACYTDDPSLAERIRTLAAHGSRNRYYYDMIGLNSRLDSLQAAVLLSKLPHLNSFIENRRAVAKQYDELLADIPEMEIPGLQKGAIHSYNQYTIRVKDAKREKLMDELKRTGITSRVYYPLPLHRQKAFKDYVKAGDSLNHSDKACEEVLSLPMHESLDAKDVEFVAARVRDFFK